MNIYFEVITDRATMLTSAKVALLVGSILALINYGDRIFVSGDMSVVEWVKLGLTYFVPYCVATYGAAKFAIRHAADKETMTSKEEIGGN